MRTKYRQVVPLLLNSPSNISVGSVTLHGTHSRPGSAQQGLAPLSAEAVCRYLSPEDGRYLGSPLRQRYGSGCTACGQRATFVMCPPGSAMTHRTIHMTCGRGGPQRSHHRLREMQTCPGRADRAAGGAQ